MTKRGDVVKQKLKLIIISIIILNIAFFSEKIYAACSYEAQLQQYAPYAQESMKNTGVYASLILAQAITEQSLNPPAHNNMFGIKVSDTKTVRLSAGESELNIGKSLCESKNGSWLQTSEYSSTEKKSYSAMACFKNYDSAISSFDDHGNWLLTKFANRTNFESATTLEEQLQALVNNPTARYATDSNYLCKLINSINSCDLTRFDNGINFSYGNRSIVGGKQTLSNNNCATPTINKADLKQGIDHFTTPYDGNLSEGWIYERFDYKELYNLDTPEYKVEQNIDDVIDEIFYRAKTSYAASYEYTSNNGGVSSGYSAKDCNEIKNLPTNSNYSTWRQGGSPWSKIKLSSASDSTIGKIGCLVTSISIQLKAMDRTAGIENFNPGTFTCYLSERGMFTSDGLLQGNWNTVVPGVSLTSGTVNGSREEQASQIKGLIDKGCHLVLYAPHGGSSHFVAVSGTTEDNIQIMDPGAGKPVLWGNIYDFNTSTGYRCLKAS